MYSKGPGFFIFFQETEILGAGGYPVIIYTVDEKPVKVKKTVFEETQKKVSKLKSLNKSVSQESVNKVINSMIDEWSPEETVNEYGIDKFEAEKRYREILEELARLALNDEEEAILLILAYI